MTKARKAMNPKKGWDSCAQLLPSGTRPPARLFTESPMLILSHVNWVILQSVGLETSHETVSSLCGLKEKKKSCHSKYLKTGRIYINLYDAFFAPIKLLWNRAVDWTPPHEQQRQAKELWTTSGLPLKLSSLTHLLCNSNHLSLFQVPRLSNRDHNT